MSWYPYLSVCFDPVTSMQKFFVVLSCFSYLQLIGIILPWAIFVGIYFKKKNFYDLHHGILGILHIYDLFYTLISARETYLKNGNFVGILYSVLITAVITDAIKDGVGRPRPDFCAVSLMEMM
jgi:hypothetical protein